MSASILRVAARGPAATTFFRANTIRPVAQPLTARAAAVLPSILAVPSATHSNFSTSARLRSEHAEETFEEFSARYDSSAVLQSRVRSGKRGFGRWSDSAAWQPPPNHDPEHHPAKDISRANG